jgi:GxxExxY protein
VDAENALLNRDVANEITGTILECSLRIHSKLGPGLLESVYQACLEHELTRAGLSVRAQLLLPVVYDGLQINAGYRIDLLVADIVIVEVKSVEQILPVHFAQLLTYLRLANKRVGLLINFNVAHLRQGVKRIVNGF